MKPIKFGIKLPAPTPNAAQSSLFNPSKGVGGEIKLIFCYSLKSENILEIELDDLYGLYLHQQGLADSCSSFSFKDTTRAHYMRCRCEEIADELPVVTPKP